MKVNHLKIYKDEVTTLAWEEYCSLEHAQVFDDYLIFNTVYKQSNSEVYTVSSYSLDKHHPLLWYLDDGMQEEHMLDMNEVIENLKKHHPETYKEFLKEVDITADNCLLLRGW